MRLICLSFCAAVSSIVTVNAAELENNAHPLVAVTAIVEHPALDAVRDGAKHALEQAGYHDGQNLRFVYQSAQNRQSTAVQIARKFVGDQARAIIAIGTPSAQAAINATRDIPVIFSAVTDPVAAGLMKDPDHPDRNVTGVSDKTPVAEHVHLIKELFPTVKKIGYLYNPSETNSVAALKTLKAVAHENGLDIVESTAIQTSQVRNATLALVGKVDVIYITTDNTIVSALETAILVANENKIPFVAADPDSAKRGALVAAGVNYRDLGEVTGQMVVRLLRGEKVADMPMQVAPANNLILNKRTATAIGYQFPQAILARATQVIE